MTWSQGALKKTSALIAMKRGDDQRSSLVSSGISRVDLAKYIADPERRSKSVSAKRSREFSKKLGTLLDNGGHVCGGASLDYVTNSHLSKDVDVFFEDFTAYVNGIMYAYDEHGIDVCLASGPVPYSTFDLHAPMCSISRKGVDISAESKCAFDTNICRIDMSNVVYATATVGRVAKYGRIRGFKFLSEEVIIAASMGDVPSHILNEAMKFCVDG